MASAVGHETISEIAPGEAIADAERYSAKKQANISWLLQRMQIDGDGVPGSYNDVMTDGWFPYNADGSVNYSDSVSFDLVSVSGTQMTLKTQDGSAAGRVLLYQRYVANPDYGKAAGLPRLLVESYFGSIMPGFVVQLSGNSVLTYACWPIITAIVSCVGDTLVVDCDKAATAALSKFQIFNDVTGEWEADPSAVTVKVWHQQGNPPRWRKVVRPDYFYGDQRIRTIREADVPENGVVQLATVQVKDPKGFDPLHPTWTLEGKRRDTGEWETVSDQNDRLYVLPTGAWVALKNEKPADGTAAPGSDLTTTYNDFRATYWIYVGPDATSCTVVGYARCVWSVPAYGYGYTPPDGAAGGYVCLKRVRNVNKQVDTDDDGNIDAIEHTEPAATGVSRFTPLCSQYNCCDQYKSAEDRDTDSAPFSMRDLRGQQEMIGMAHQRLVRILPRTPGFGAWQAQCIGHPSIMWHHGYIGLATPSLVDEPFSAFRGMGMWGTGYETYTDVDGNEYLDLVTGGMDGLKHGPWVTDEGNTLIDTDGNLLALTGYNQKRDPVIPGATRTERELERIGAAVEKDTGVMQYGGGLSQSSVAVASQNVIVPNVDLNGEGVQVRSGGSFERVPGSGAIVRLQALRQATKEPVLLGSRTVHSVSAASGVATHEYLNVTHIFGVTADGPEIGDSYSQRLTWDAGGGWPILPIEGHRVNSHFESPKVAGSRAQGAWRGDSVKIGDRVFVLASTGAHEGSAADAWGEDTTMRFDYITPVVWRPDRANIDFTDDDGNTYYGDVAIVTVTNTDTSTVLTLVESDTRPASIAAGEYWWDGDALFVETAGNYQVDYEVTDRYHADVAAVAYTEYPVVPALGTMPTEISSDDWTASDSQAVTFDGAAPATGYAADASGATVTFTFALVDAGKSAAITLTFAGLAPPDPLDGYCLTNDYTTFGKNRDQAELIDDLDGAAAAATAGTIVEFYKGLAVSLPGWTLEWTAYDSDAWEAVPCDVHAGNGEGIIGESWFADKSGAGCFRFVNVQLMDHRGIVPGSLLTKIETWAAADKWVSCVMGSGLGFFSGGKYASDIWTIPTDENGCDMPQELMDHIEGDWSDGNSIRIDQIFFGGNEVECSARISYESLAVFGPPLPLTLLPPDTTIVEAHAEMMTSGLSVNDGEPTGIDYAVIGFTGRDTYEAIGLSIGGAANGQKVVNVTSIMQAMFAEQGSGKYAYGYGLIFLPFGSGTGDLNDLIPGPPPTHTETGDQYPCGSQTTWTDAVQTHIVWGGVTFGRIFLLVRYGSGELERLIVQPEWAAQG